MRKEYKTLYEKFGLNVVYYRKRKKLTQLQLAELVDIDRSHISAIELGNVGVSFDVIFKMCEVLEYHPRTFLTFVTEAKEPQRNAAALDRFTDAPFESPLFICYIFCLFLCFYCF